jgi:Mechanosensitive ion channel, beta-domain/Mechanosensitive ion channel MscS, C-terminal/Mechanosensitive ion channel, transmembrane helices 2/3
VRLSVFGADHAPPTLTGSCGSVPGVTCRLVWDVSHNGRAALLTNEFLAGPVHLLLQVLFVVLLALVIQWLVHRLINRLTTRASQSLLPQLRNGMAGSLFAPTAGRVSRRLVRRRRSPTDDAIADDAAAARAEAARTGAARTGAARTGAARTGAARTGALREVAPGGPSVSLAQVAVTEGAGQGAVNAASAQAEAALVDERRKQRVQALGAILRSAASVTIFAIAGFAILGDLGINLAPLLASAGVVGVAIGFGAQSLVKDYLSGIFMLVEDQYGVGDVITVGTATGTVENVTLRVTRMRDVNGIVWHIRNGTIDTVGNESQGWARAVIDFPVPFDADLTTIRDLLTQAGSRMWNEPTWRVVMLEAPEVWGAQEITKDQVTMRIVAKTAPLRQWEVEREMRARIKRTLKEAGIMPPPAAESKLAVRLTGGVIEEL